LRAFYAARKADFYFIVFFQIESLNILDRRDQFSPKMIDPGVVIFSSSDENPLSHAIQTARPRGDAPRTRSPQFLVASIGVARSSCALLLGAPGSSWFQMSALVCFRGGFTDDVHGDWTSWPGSWTH